jgi:hypothetical protein
MKSLLGATLVLALLLIVCLAGGLFLGPGVGELAVVTFLGASLVFAAVRGDAGCELMSIPGALFGGRSSLPCIVFSPIDWLERKLRGKRRV